MPAARITYRCRGICCRFGWRSHASVDLHGDERAAFAYIRSHNTHCQACGHPEPTQLEAAIVPAPWEKPEGTPTHV